MIVVDTNLIVALTTKSPQRSLALSVQDKDPNWIAPRLWESEYRNAMVGMIRGGVMGHKAALEAFRLASERIDTLQVDTGPVLHLAEQYGLTAYDAEFACLAFWQDIPCLSFDEHLLRVGLATHPKDF